MSSGDSFVISDGGSTRFVQTPRDEDCGCGSVWPGSPFPEHTTSPWRPCTSLAQTPQHAQVPHVLLLLEHPRPWLPSVTDVCTALPLCYSPGGLAVPCQGAASVPGPRAPTLPPSSESPTAAQRQSPGHFACSQCPLNSPVPKPAPRARLDPECSGPEITRPLRSLAWTAGRTSPCASASHEGSGQGCRHPRAELAPPGAAGDTGRESALPGSEARGREM